MLLEKSRRVPLRYLGRFLWPKSVSSVLTVYQSVWDVWDVWDVSVVWDV